MGGPRRRTAGIAALLAAFASLGYLALDAGDDAAAIAPDAPPRELYARTDRCDTPCAAVAAAERFSVSADVTHVELVVYAALDPESGPARITVIDPSGDVRFDEVFTGAPAEDAAREETARWTSEIGEWTLARSYAGSTGRLELQVWGALS